MQTLGTGSASDKVLKNIH